MSKIYNIRWQQSDNEDLRKAVKNFNAKITRLEKKFPEQKNALPERMSVKQIRELITSRQDLKRELNALRRFTKPGAEELVDAPDTDYNLKLTKWQKEEMTRRTAVINRRRADRYEAIKDIEMTSKGEGLGYTFEQAKESIGMGSVDANSTKPLNAFTPKMTQTDLKAKFRTILKESQQNYWNEREQIMKETYIKTILEHFKEGDISDVIDAIDNMNFKEFYSKFLSEGGHFEFLYPPDEEQYASYVEGLKSTWLPNYSEE